MIFAPFECAFEGAFEWCKNHENPIKIDEFRMQKLFTILIVCTQIGWKGFVFDPDLNGTDDINKGLVLGRKLMRDINALGMPCAVEFLNPISAQYSFF